MPDHVATRFLGGSPLTVLIRLGALSLVVGALMSWWGVDALDLLAAVERGFAHLYGTGFAALHNIARTVAAGAAVVLPVWLVLRLLSYRGPRTRLGPDHHRGAATYEDASRWSNPQRVGD